MASLFFSFLVVTSLIVLHECGHILCAYSLNMPIKKIGFTLSPFPHVFVAIKWPSNKFYTYLFLLSGFIVFLILTIFVYYIGLFNVDFIKNAFLIQSIIEINPIYSDFIILKIISNKRLKNFNSNENYLKLYKKIYLDYIFSKYWYIHFAIWTFFLYLILK